MLCYAMLCYAMLCYAMLCYAMLCYAMLCYAILYYTMLCYAVLCYAMLCYAMQCYAMLCYDVFFRSGTRLATASSTGTVIRVFDVPSGTKLYSFRRGNRPTTITSISFSPNSEFIAVGSSSGTVHVFSFEAYDQRFQVAGAGSGEAGGAGAPALPAPGGAHAGGAGAEAGRSASRDSAASGDAPGWKDTIRSNRYVCYRSLSF
jgi:hypothetical protein